MAQWRFLSCQRISQRRDFAAFRLSSLRMRGPGFLLVVKKNSEPGLPLPRLGLVASKKTGNAVRRNALRRRFREDFRLFPNENLKGLDFLVIFQPDSQRLVLQTMGKAFQDLLRKIAAMEV